MIDRDLPGDVAESPRDAAAGGRRLRLAGPGGAPGRRSVRRGAAPANPLSPRPPHFPARAKRVIFLFMPGGPSQVDTFDPKPRLTRDHGKPSPKLYLGQKRNLLASPWRFQQAGRVRPRGERALPARRVVHRSAVRHPLDGGRRRQPSRRLLADEHGRAGGHAAEPGRLGDLRPGHREPEPARLHRHRPGPLIEGARQYGAGFLPAAYQGTFVSDLQNPIRNLKNDRVSPDRQRRELDALRRLNDLHREERAEDSRLSARIESFELAYRMQMQAPDAFDLTGETDGDEAALRHRSEGDRGLRPPVPAGAAAGGARRAVRAAVPHHRRLSAVGPAQRPQGRPCQERPGDRPADRRLAART